MSNILIYGGSFNPPTLAHKALLEDITKKFAFDEIILIPTNNFYQKEDLIASKHRIQMLQLMFPNYIISDIELKKETQVYTIDMVREVQVNYPLSTIYIMMGSDNFKQMHLWKQAESLLKTFHFIVYIREVSDLSYLSQNTLIEHNLHNITFCSLSEDIASISSTKLRQDVKENRRIINTSKEVLAYFKSNYLYKGEVPYGKDERKTTTF